MSGIGAWLWVIVGSGVLVGVTNILLKISTTKSVGMLPMGIYFVVVGAVVIGFALAKQPNALAANVALPQGLAWAMVAALVGAASALMLFTALGQGAPAGLVFTVFNVTSIVVTVVLSGMVLHEPLGMMQVVGIALALLSVGILAW